MLRRRRSRGGTGSTELRVGTLDALPEPLPEPLAGAAAVGMVAGSGADVDDVDAGAGGLVLVRAGASGRASEYSRMQRAFQTERDASSPNVWHLREISGIKLLQIFVTSSLARRTRSSPRRPSYCAQRRAVFT